MSNLGDNIKQNTQNQKKFNEAISEGAMAYREYEDLFKSIQGELGKKVSAVKDATKSYDQLVSATSQLKLNEEEITRLSDKQIQQNENKAKAALADLRHAAESLSFQKQQLINDKNGNLLQGAALEARIKSKLLSGEITKEEAALLRAKATNFALEEEMVAKAGEDVEKRKELNKALGIAGGLLKGLSVIAGPLAQTLQIDKIQKDMEEFAEKSIKAGKSVSRLQTLGVGLQSAFKNLKLSLTDPLTIFTALYNSAKAVSQEVTNLQRATGMSYGNATALNAELRMTAQTSGQIQISAKKLHEAFSQITTELGVSADILGGEALISMSNLTKKIGLGAKEATQLTLMSRLQGKNTEQVLDNAIATVGEYNKQNKTAINFKTVLSDVANSSKRLQVSLGANPEALMEAATSARALGLSLSEMEGIADNLLNFESSIQKELEAELLTGKELNLEKAREFALNNDIKGLTEEIGKNQEITSAFASGNRIQQKAIAEAMGMSVEQLSNMYYQQELNNLSAEEFKNRYGETAYEQAKASSASEKFGYTLDRVKEIIGNIGMALAPVLDLVAAILSKWYILYPVMGLVALSLIPKLAKGAKDFASNIKEGFSSIKGIAKGVSDVVTGKGGGKLKEAVGLGGDKTKEAADKAGDGVAKSADKTKGVKGNKGKEVEQFLKGLGRGLKFIGQNAVEIIKGGGALLLATPGLIGLSLAAPGLALLGMVPGKGVELALKGLARGIIFIGKKPAEILKGAAVLGAVGLVLGGSFALAMMMLKDVSPGQMIAFSASLTMLGIAMALLGNLGANILLGAAAMAILAISLIPAAFAFSLLAGVDVGSMIAFSIALPLLALAAAGLGFLAPFIIYGSVALAALGLALIPAAEAFSNLKGIDSKALSSFSEGVYDLAWSVAGLGFLAPAIVLGGVAMAALGLALIPLSQGFAALAAVNIEGALEGFIELASIAPGLTATAAALFAVAGGMAAVAVAGYLAVPAMALMSLFGGIGDSGEGKKEDEMVKMNEKLDKLIAVVEAGGDVYIDGTKVGKTLQLASSKMG